MKWRGRVSGARKGDQRRMRKGECGGTYKGLICDNYRFQHPTMNVFIIYCEHVVVKRTQLQKILIKNVRK